MSKTPKRVMIEQAYTLIRRPIISEKATSLTTKGQIVFLVEPQATKPQLKKAIESLYDVKVKAINTIFQKGKRKRFRRVWGRRKNYKKAIITLEKDQNIDLLTGVKS